MSIIRQRVLEALGRNRSPGLHFAGNFAPLAFASAPPGESRLSLEAAPHIADADGQASFAAVAMLADVALGVSIRSRLAPESRLATVSLHLQLTGLALRGSLEARGVFASFLEESSGRQGLARVEVNAPEGIAAFGSGAFMVLPPPPGVTLHPVVRTRSDAPLTQDDLTAEERAVLDRADAALAQADAHHPFIARFWGCEPEATSDGARCVTPNGAHIANRVGHVQGGLLVGLAAATASAALGPQWVLSSISSWFVSPGEGDTLVTESSVTHRGRLTAVVRSQVLGVGGRRVLESVSSHALR
jgi:acyl-coenzyme A thioesterase PaaI-like protein